MSKTDGNDPVSMDHTGREFLGLTKREYFAAMAMQGLLSGNDESIRGFDQLAKMAVSNADALIESLNQNTEQ